MRVMMAIDELADIDAEMSDEILFEYVDPDALDALFQSVSGAPREDGHVTFSVDGHEVTVTATGEVVVRTTRPD